MSRKGGNWKVRFKIRWKKGKRELEKKEPWEKNKHKICA